MSDHEDKRRRWGSLKQKILANRSGNNINDGTKVSKTVKNTLTRFSRMKHEKPPKPGTCLPVQQPTKNAPIPSLLCSVTQQKFKLLDDDTFSTRPLIGFASKYTNHHYSEVWLADYVNATRKKAQIASAPESQRKGASQKSVDQPVNTIAPQHQSGTKDTGGLGQEIDRLSRTLNKVSFVRDTTQGGRSYHVSGFDVQSTTSHTSSIDTSSSEFSFEADFTQLTEQQRSATTGIDNQVSSNIPVVDTTPEGVLPQEQQYYLETKCTNVSNLELQPQPQPYSADRLFQPILSELDEQGDLMLYEQRFLGKDPVLPNDCQWNDSNHATTGCHDQDLPGQVAVGIQPDLMVVPEPNIVDAPFDEYIRYPEEHIFDPSSDEDHLGKPVDEIYFSSEDSNIASEITTEAGSSLTGDHMEPPRLVDDNLMNLHVKQGAARNGDAFRKAKCVVVYDKHFSETDNRFYDDVPANVKEIVDRLEVLRRLQVDHAEKFGYKDFLPILEDQKQGSDVLAPTGYREYQKESDNQFFHMLSYSFESESLLSVSPVEQTDHIIQQGSV